jgi:mannosylfructose-phosphate synthase
MVSTHGYVAADPPLGSPDTGGQVVYVLELSKKLAQLGYKVDIWTRRFDDQPETEPVCQNVRIIRMRCGGEYFIPKEYLHEKLGEWCENALRFMRKKKLHYQFLVSHYWDAGDATNRLSSVLDVPHIFVPHSLGLWKQRKMETDNPADSASIEETYNFSTRIRHEKTLCREADAVVATSPLQLDMLRKEYGASRNSVHMIPPGYDDARFFAMGDPATETIKEEVGLGDKRVVASIGRLSRNKGFDLLVEAFGVVAERDSRAVLKLAVGSELEATTEDPMLQELVDLVESLGLKDRVLLTGSLPDEQMADFYRAADVFCLPSRYEPFGMTAVEAMACGTPVVLTTHGGLYRTTRYGIDALFADPFDKYDFGTTILHALRFRPLRERLSIEGARKARSLFTWTGIAQQIIRLVEDRGFGYVQVADELEP